MKSLDKILGSITRNEFFVSSPKAESSPMVPMSRDLDDPVLQRFQVLNPNLLHFLVTGYGSQNSEGISSRIGSHFCDCNFTITLVSRLVGPS